MTRVKAFWTGSWAGMIVTTLGHLIHQDFMGREWYVAHVRDNWINLPWQLWVGVFALFVLATSRTQSKLRAKDNEAVDKT